MTLIELIQGTIQLAQLHPLATLFLAVFVPCMAYVAYQCWKTFKAPSRGSKQQEAAFWKQFAQAQRIRK